MSDSKLRQKLNTIYKKYHSPSYLKMDPVRCVRCFTDPYQIEIAGLIASTLAYGRVEGIIRSIESVFHITGYDIYSFVVNTSFTEKKKLLRHIKHRFNSGLDIAVLLEAVKSILKGYGSLETLFINAFNEGCKLKEAASSFVSIIKKNSPVSKNRRNGYYFEYLLPSPSSGSACKRLNMYFRWMIRREDGIDCGIWDSVSPSILIIPVDVHVARAAKVLKLTSRKSVDWKMAEEITAQLRKIDPNDPVKYDFSLCRFGMRELKVRN